MEGRSRPPAAPPAAARETGEHPDKKQNGLPGTSPVASPAPARATRPVRPHGAGQGPASTASAAEATPELHAAGSQAEVAAGGEGHPGVAPAAAVAARGPAVVNSKSGGDAIVPAGPVDAAGADTGVLRETAAVPEPEPTRPSTQVERQSVRKHRPSPLSNLPAPWQTATGPRPRGNVTSDGDRGGSLTTPDSAGWSTERLLPHAKDDVHVSGSAGGASGDLTIPPFAGNGSPLGKASSSGKLTTPLRTQSMGGPPAGAASGSAKNDGSPQVHPRGVHGSKQALRRVLSALDEPVNELTPTSGVVEVFTVDKEPDGRYGFTVGTRPVRGLG